MCTYELYFLVVLLFMSNCFVCVYLRMDLIGLYTIIVKMKQIFSSIYAFIQCTAADGLYVLLVIL